MTALVAFVVCALIACCCMYAATANLSRIIELEQAIRDHRDSNSHIKHWKANIELYQHLPEGHPHEQSQAQTN